MKQRIRACIYIIIIIACFNYGITSAIEAARTPAKTMTEIFMLIPRTFFWHFE